MWSWSLSSVRLGFPFLAVITFINRSVVTLSRAKAVEELIRTG